MFEQLFSPRYHRKVAVPLAFHLCCFNFSAVLVVRVPFPFGVWGRMWNSIVSVPDHCRFMYFSYVCKCIPSVSHIKYILNKIR